MANRIPLSATLRLATGVAFMGVTIVLISNSLGMGRNERLDIAQARSALGQAMVMFAANDLGRGDLPALQQRFDKLVLGSHELVSVGLRKHDQLVVSTKNHAENWWRKGGDEGQMSLEVDAGNDDVATLELCFQQRHHGWFGQNLGGRLRQFAFVIALGILLCAFYLKEMAEFLAPSSVIPDRVRSALNTFAEGLLVLDRHRRIVLANRTFAKTLGLSSEQLQGKLVDELPWELIDGECPWRDAFEQGRPRTGRMVKLRAREDQCISYMTNASPIYSDRGRLQGILASFDDVTLHEKRKQELERTLRILEASREKIRQQNIELRILATRDPLTGCSNRRYFFELAEQAMENCRDQGLPFAVMMVDVDHFKALNDKYGHTVGDKVLGRVGAKLLEFESDEIKCCRYGGEEFCVALENHDDEKARHFAEQVRVALEAISVEGTSITGSLGVAIAKAGESGFQDLLDEADQSMYIAKRRGRNRVVCRWEVGGRELNMSVSAADSRRVKKDQSSGIPFHAVTALVSALSYRDAATARHSRRVADLVVILGRKLMTPHELYVLEISALLHDIGKIGTPDALLLKPGALDAEERNVMSYNDEIGLEIIRSTFENQQLLDIIASYRAWFGGHPQLQTMPSGGDIPLGARILSICDAYDSMRDDRAYQKGVSLVDACSELRRCAGAQFDPALVEMLVELLETEDNRNSDLTWFDRMTLPNLDKPSALRIGVLVESLTQSLESEDAVQLRVSGEDLFTVAAELRLHDIAAMASELLQQIDDGEEAEIQRVAGSLLDLCRMTQRAYLTVDEEARRQREKHAQKQFSKEFVE